MNTPRRANPFAHAVPAGKAIVVTLVTAAVLATGLSGCMASSASGWAQTSPLMTPDVVYPFEAPAPTGTIAARGIDRPAGRIAAPVD